MTHAIRFHKPGGPEVLVWEEIKLGKPGPDGFFAPPQRPGMFLQVTVAGVRSTFREFTMPGLAAVCRTS